MKIPALLLLTLISSGAAEQISAQSSNGPVHLSSQLKDGRFYLKLPVSTGDTIVGFCDTGGGYTAVYPVTLKRLKLESKVSVVTIDGENNSYILASDLLGSPDIPAPQIANYYKPYIKSGFFSVPDEKETDFLMRDLGYDAFLGQFFFMGHSWTFNYKSGEIFINTPLSMDTSNANMQVLGFKKDRSGNKRFGHPSMKIMVDGESLDMLFDTGASFILSDNGKSVFGAGKTTDGGSFLAKSVFDKWHKQHPDWRFIEKGELTGADMIEVPQVKVGNLVAGPVWFARRPDEAWSKGMINTMDKVVKGAIGSSFLKYFKVVIDYNSELIVFEK